jgi:hypothetical protein
MTQPSSVPKALVADRGADCLHGAGLDAGIYCALEPPPPIGRQSPGRDAVHNLRSSLDLLACVLVRANGKTSVNNTYFPINADRKTFEADGLKKIKGASQVTCPRDFGPSVM